MNAMSDPELLDFAAKIIEVHGGLIEGGGEDLLALLPEGLAARLGLSEEARLGGDEAPLLYGSPLLDRLVDLATEDVPVAYARLEIPYLKKAGFERSLHEELSFDNSQVRVIGRAEARSTYMVLSCRYVALSDERKEGLVQAVVNEESGAIAPDLAERWPEFAHTFFAPDKVSHNFPTGLDHAVTRGLDFARACAEAELAEFIRNMERRLRRDTKNTREYYEALRKEMAEGLARRNLTDRNREERMTKIRELPEEADRKVRDLEQKYLVKVTVEASAALRLLVPVVRIMIDIRHRKSKRSLPLTWNPVNGRFDPLVCEGCRESAYRVFPVEEKGGLRLLCGEC